MPRNRFLAQIDSELIQAKKSLVFWRDQVLLFPDAQLQECAKAQVAAYEKVVAQLIAVQEKLLSMEDNQAS